MKIARFVRTHLIEFEIDRAAPFPNLFSEIFLKLNLHILLFQYRFAANIMNVKFSTPTIMQVNSMESISLEIKPKAVQSWRSEAISCSSYYLTSNNCIRIPRKNCFSCYFLNQFTDWGMSKKIKKEKIIENDLSWPVISA